MKTFADATEAFYNSAEFKQKEKENEEFFNQLPLYLDGRPVSLKNMVCSFLVYDINPY